MLRWLAFAAIAALAALVACGHAPRATSEPGTAHAAPVAPPPPIAADAAVPLTLDEDLPRLAERSVAMYRDLATLLGAASTDCPGVAAKLDVIASDNKEVLEANAKVLHAGHDRIQQLKAALEPHQAELDAAAQTLAASQTMKGCAHDAAFARAIDRLLGEP